MRFVSGTRLRLAMTSAALLSGAMLAAAEPASPAYKLRYQFHRGDEVYFTVRNEVIRRFDRSGKEVQTRDGHDSLKHFRVQSVDAAGQSLLELKIDHTRMFAQQRDLVFTYDSATDAAPSDAFAAVHGTIGHPWLYVTVNDRGKIVEARTPEGESAADAATSSDLIARVLPVLPEQDVAVGTVWKETYEVSVSETEKLKKPIRMQRTYKLVRVEDNVATIEFSTQVITAQKTPLQEAFLAQGIYTGTVTFDIARGLLLSQDLHVNQSVIGYDGPGTAMSIVLSQKDEYAPGGASTPLPASRTAHADAAAAEK